MEEHTMTTQDRTKYPYMVAWIAALPDGNKKYGAEIVGAVNETHAIGIGYAMVKHFVPTNVANAVTATLLTPEYVARAMAGIMPWENPS